MGARITLSPLVFGGTPTALDLSVALCNGTKAIDLPLATAVSWSARFPWITPAGWFEKKEAWSKDCGETPREGEALSAAKRNRLYLVDGGYFENSGLETVLEIAGRLRCLCAHVPRRSPASRPNASTGARHFIHLR